MKTAHSLHDWSHCYWKMHRANIHKTYHFGHMKKLIVLSTTKKHFDFQQLGANLQILYKENMN